MMTIEAETFFKERQYYARTRDILQSGFKRSELDKLLKNKQINKVKRGWYEWNDKPVKSDWELINQYIPNGVLALYSSALHHNLTTFIPSTYQIVVQEGTKVKLPPSLPIKLHEWTPNFCNFGIQTANIDGYAVKVFDVERTVCDLMRFHWVMFDVAKEALKTYIDLPTRDIGKLLKYAQKLNIEKKMELYLQILL